MIKVFQRTQKLIFFVYPISHATNYMFDIFNNICYSIRIDNEKPKQPTGRDSMNTLTVTADQAVDILTNNVKGAEIVTVDLDSDMDGKGKMRKTGNPFIGQGIVKRETLNGMIGYIYSNSVNRIADKEGKEEREVKRHPWGDMDSKHLFRTHRHNGNKYLSMKVQNVTVHGFFRPDGSEVPADEIRPFIPKKKKSSTQADLEGEVIARDYAMRNIKAIRMRHMEIAVVQG